MADSTTSWTTSTSPTQTTSSTASSTSSAGGLPQKEQKLIADLVAIGIVGFYGLLTIITLLAWSIRRCTRSSHPEAADPSPEAVMRGNSAFLAAAAAAPASQSRSPARQPHNHNASSKAGAHGSDRSMFYDGPGHSHSQTNSQQRAWHGTPRGAPPMPSPARTRGGPPIQGGGRAYRDYYAMEHLPPMPHNPTLPNVMLNGDRQRSGWM